MNGIGWTVFANKRDNNSKQKLIIGNKLHQQIKRDIFGSMQCVTNDNDDSNKCGLQSKNPKEILIIR